MEAKRARAARQRRVQRPPERDEPRYDGRTLTAKELASAINSGHENFQNVNLDGVNLRGIPLRGISFFGASMRGAALDRQDLTHVQLKAANLARASLRGADIIASDSISAIFAQADLRDVDFTGSSLNRSQFQGADLRNARFNNTRLNRTALQGANLERVRVGGVQFAGTDVRPFCDARYIKHDGRSYVDPWTVAISYTHTGLKKFMQDCGVPAIFAEFMIECAYAQGEPLLRRMMQSTFISYGGPDDRFARRLYDALRENRVTVFYFPQTATVGERINSEVFKGIQEHDRVILVCSEASLDRPGVLNEIQETLDREARDGGSTYLLPITLDDYVFTGWKTAQPVLAERIGRRVVADFRKTQKSRQAFDAAFSRLLDALKIRHPSVGP